MVFHIHRHRCLGMVRRTRRWSRLLGQFQLLKLCALRDATVGKARENHDFFGKVRSGMKMVKIAIYSGFSH